MVVRDFFRTYQLAWRDISAFEMPPRYRTWRKAGLRIHLLNGQLISATLYSRGRLDSGNAARKVIGELEQLRHQRTQDADAILQPPIAPPEADQPD